GLRQQTEFPAIVRDPGRRLRVGYVSPDFRQHALSSCLEPLLAAHDRDRFEVVCYDDDADADNNNEPLRRCADRWISVHGLDRAAAAERIRADRIDLLIDLAGHYGHNRLEVFARKPAPVQFTYLGYPATTGLSAIDYRIADHITEPSDIELWSSEQVI